jgi:hypothetical protein
VPCSKVFCDTCNPLTLFFHSNGKEISINRNGHIELFESPPSDLEGKVIVTFLNGGSADLAERGIDARQAADLRQRLKPFSEDWVRPEMDVYDMPTINAALRHTLGL